MNKLLTKKYEPKTLDEIQLQDKSMDSVIAWANGWLNGIPDPAKPALLLYGAPGVGKTATAHSICNDCDFEIIELNASDVRTKDQLAEFTPRQSLSGARSCVILDECDSMSPNEKGGVTIFKQMIASRQFPVIVTANSIHGVPAQIKELCEAIQVYRPSINALKTYLYDIVKKEKINISSDILDAAANTQDYRLALGMIENNMIASGAPKITYATDNVRNLVLGEPIILSKPGKYDTKRPKEISSLLYYLDENCHTLYSSWDLYKIYEILIRVDQFRRQKRYDWAEKLLQTIPKTAQTEFEIVAPIKYNKEKPVV